MFDFFRKSQPAAPPQERPDIHGAIVAMWVSLAEKIHTSTRALREEIHRMSKQLDDLTAAVAAEKTVTQSAVALLGELKAKLDAAIDLASEDDGAALNALSADLGASTKALADAVSANTPAAEPVTAPDVPAPAPDAPPAT